MKRAVAFFLVHITIWTGLVYVGAGSDRLDYDKLGESSTPWVRQFQIALLAVLVLQVAFLTRERWWGDVFRDTPRSARWWMWLPPVFIVLVGLALLTNEGVSDAPRSYWIGMTITMLLVGITEEITFRGILVVGARRQGSNERSVLLMSSALFGLFHFPNWILGQDLVDTLRQVIFTAVIGTAFYALRRASGTLMACIALHAAYDWVIIQGAFA